MAIAIVVTRSWMGKIALGRAADVRRFRDWLPVLRLSDRAASMSRPCILPPESWGGGKPGMIRRLSNIG